MADKFELNQNSHDFKHSEMWLNNQNRYFDTHQFELKKLELICDSIYVDVTYNYDDWLRAALAISELGEDGRKYFNKISSYYPDYNVHEANEKYTNALQNRNGSLKINTFYQIVKDSANIDLNSISKKAYAELNRHQNKSIKNH